MEEGAGMTDFLTYLELPGSRGILPCTATRQEREALSLHLAALKAQGHAIACDEIMEFGDSSGGLRVTHFLSCERCKKGAM